MAPLGDGPAAFDDSPSRDGGLTDDGLTLATGVEGFGEAGDSAGTESRSCALALVGGTVSSERACALATLPAGDAGSAVPLAAVERVRVCD